MENFLMTQKMSHSKKYDYAKVRTLAKIAGQYIDQIYQYFGLSISYRNDILIKSACPIHGGDNPTALNVYPNGDFKAHYKCRTHQCEEVFGVVSTEPAYLMNSAMEGTGVAVALSGRVPCKVIGTVRKGQRLVVSSTPGVAKASDTNDWKCIIGRALEEKTTEEVDVIEVVVGVK